MLLGVFRSLGVLDASFEPMMIEFDRSQSLLDLCDSEIDEACEKRQSDEEARS